MKTEIPSINTGRLTLRPLCAADAQALFHIYQQEGVLRYFPNTKPPALERIEGFITSQQAHWEKFGYGNWGILPDGRENIAGWVGLQFLPELDETEVGFLLGKNLWGLGYATEAARASIQFGFENFKLDHIIALVHPDNLASRRVIEKCGLSYIDRLHLWGIDLLRYSLVAANKGRVLTAPGMDGR